MTRKACKNCKERFSAISKLSDQEIDLLQESCHESELSKGEVIFHQGSITSHIVYVRSGLVLEYQKRQNGRDQIIQIVKSRSYLGLHSLFGDSINRYSYRALENLKICYINVEAFKQLIRQNGSFAYEILVSVSRDSLSKNYRFLSFHAKQTYGKVADALLYFANVIYENDEFILSITRSDIGALIGISRESTTRAMNKLQQDNVIEMSGNKIRIKSREALEKISKTG